MNLAARYNQLVRELAPQVVEYLVVPAELTTRFQIEEQLRSQGEFIEGMGSVIISVAEQAA